jgi:hypothetical protein
VVPEFAERRQGPERASEGDNAQRANEKQRPDRRRQKQFRVPLGEPWSSGWLAFESQEERRRLAPYPDNWESFSEAELDALCEAAVRMRSHGRRFIE